MRKLKLILGLALLIFAINAAWQVGSAYIASQELQEDLRDIAGETAARIGLAPPSTEDDLRGFVLQKAQSHDIDLQPDQVTVRFTGAGRATVIYLAADYTTDVNLIFYTLTLHFTPASDKKFI